MNMTEIHSAIRSRFDANFGSEFGVLYDNAPASPSVPGVPEKPRIRCAIRTANTRQVSIGGLGSTSNQYRVSGVLLVTILGPVGEGDGSLLQLADRIVDKFRGVTDGGVTFRTPSVNNLGRFGSNWQINIQCPFYSDSTGTT